MGTTLNGPLLSIEDLSIHLTINGRPSIPVASASFDVGRGECLGIVGESGSGKSLTLRAILGLLPPTGTARGHMSFADQDGVPQAGDVGHSVPVGISMVFQEPMTALNPTMRVGDLVAEGIRAHSHVPSREARRRAVDLLRDVGVPDPERRARLWPHQLSGGLRQRVMIAVALSVEPTLLLCDEPTTALDVTIQDQILALLGRLRAEREMSIVFVTHDLAVVAEICDRVAVMYAGQIVEIGAVSEVLTAPRHPYTAALIEAVPSFQDTSHQLRTIEGRPPTPLTFPEGCRFASRCAHAQEDCLRAEYGLKPHADGLTSCIHPELLRSRLS